MPTIIKLCTHFLHGHFQVSLVLLEYYENSQQFQTKECSPNTEGELILVVRYMKIQIHNITRLIQECRWRNSKTLPC